MKSLYFIILFGTVCIPLLFSFHPKIRFDRTFKTFFITNSLVALYFIAWDIWFTQRGIWGFNPKYVSGFNLINLPVEEVLFFVCIPFSCVFTYFCLTRFYEFTWSPTVTKYVVILLATLLFIAGIIFIERSYTALTFLSLSLFMLFMHYTGYSGQITRLLSIYPILLIPFFIVNGILTGTGPDQPVVWYNNDENLGIRLLTIPVEDVFYGFELIILNIWAFDFLSHNPKPNRSAYKTKSAQVVG